MPLTTSAKKALRRSIRQQADNYRVRGKVKKALDIVKKGSNKPEDLQNVYSVLDTAAKRGVIHTNKASRLKSRLSALVKRRGGTVETSTPKKAQVTKVTKVSKVTKVAKVTKKAGVKKTVKAAKAKKTA